MTSDSLMRLNSTLPPSRRQAGTGRVLLLAGAAPRPQEDVCSTHNPRTIHAVTARRAATLGFSSCEDALGVPQENAAGAQRTAASCARPMAWGTPPDTAGQIWGELEGGEREGAALLLPRSHRPRRCRTRGAGPSPWPAGRCSQAGPAVGAGAHPTPGRCCPGAPSPHRAGPGGVRGLLSSPPPLAPRTRLGTPKQK